MVIEQTTYELIPVGEYPAVITDIELEEGNYGQQLKFRFEVIEGEYAGKDLLGWCSPKLNPRSKLYGWAAAALNGNIPKQLDTDDLLAKEVTLTVVKKVKEDGATYNKIDSVAPYIPANVPF